MSETSTPRGEIRIVGVVHGAINARVLLTDGEWWFSQFLSLNQLEEFAVENSLTIVKEEE